MKSLVIAEKPSVARDIARVLKCNKNISGAIEGNQYIVTWALGHLVTLADPEGYDKKFKEWNMQVLPMMPKKMELVVIKKTAKQYNAVKTQMFRKDVGDIIIATDAGREGELVARWILEKANCHKPIKRLWISSVTDKAIKEGFAKLVDGRKYNDLYAAAVSRAEADWLVGINNVQIQRAAVLRACTDTDTCDDCKAGGRDSHIPAERVLWCDCAGRKNQVDMAGSKVGKLPFIFKRTNRKAGRRFEW